MLRLPALASVERRAAGGALPVRSDAASRRVLVVDDNVDAAESLARVLRMHAHSVQTVYDGAAALEAAAGDPPDVFVLDIGLPVVDGHDVARSLRARSGTAGSLLIAVTGYGLPEDVARSTAAGFDHHLVKPTDPERIASLIDAWGRTATAAGAAPTNAP